MTWIERDGYFVELSQAPTDRPMTIGMDDIMAAITRTADKAAGKARILTALHDAGGSATFLEVAKALGGCVRDGGDLDTDLFCQLCADGFIIEYTARGQQMPAMYRLGEPARALLPPKPPPIPTVEAYGALDDEGRAVALAQARDVADDVAGQVAALLSHDAVAVVKKRFPDAEQFDYRVHRTEGTAIWEVRDTDGEVLWNADNDNDPRFDDWVLGDEPEACIALDQAAVYDEKNFYGEHTLTIPDCVLI